jgi:hypothetical protein
VSGLPHLRVFEQQTPVAVCILLVAIFGGSALLVSDLLFWGMKLDRGGLKQNARKIALIAFACASLVIWGLSSSAGIGIAYILCSLACGKS